MARRSPHDGFSYTLLTASDGGIGCSFLLLAADFTMLMCPSRSVRVRTVSPPGAAAGGGEWTPVASAATHRRSHCSSLQPYCSAVVIGGSVHWAMHGGVRDRFHILTYDVRTATAGSIELPVDHLPESYRVASATPTCAWPRSRREGWPMAMLVRDRLKVSVWELSAGGGWAQRAVIDRAGRRASCGRCAPRAPTSYAQILLLPHSATGACGRILHLRHPRLLLRRPASVRHTLTPPSATPTAPCVHPRRPQLLLRIALISSCAAPLRRLPRRRWLQSMSVSSRHFVKVWTL